MRTRIASGLAAVALLSAAPAAQQPSAPASPPQPPTFRVGVGAVRLDVTVIGRDGLPVSDLTREDFDVREDGVVQRVRLFQHVSLSGEPPAGSDESLTIRSPDHARQVAERDDVRLLVIFIDDYHLRASPLDDVRLRHDLVRFIKEQMRPLDLLAVMGPLTPLSDLGLTRDMSALLKRVNGLEGRLGGFVPPRSVVEEAQMRLGAADLIRIRAQISLSALESLVVHLGGLRDGRKSVLFVSQGPPLLTSSVDLHGELREVIAAANRNNVTIHTFDPRQLGEARMMGDANASLSADTGGRRIGLTNDSSRPLRGVMADASSYYLLGYESPSTAADGKFRKINVEVRRKDVRVIARNGYWAPRPEELRTAAAASSSKPLIPPDVAEALDSLRDQRRRIAVADWVGVQPLDQRQSLVTVVFETLAARAPAPRVAGVELEATGRDGIKTLHTPVEGPAGVWSAHFNAAPGGLQLRATVKDTSGAVIDTWSRAIAVPDADDHGQVGTPMVYRPASLVQYRALMAGSEMAPSVTRRFRRTDRALVRLALGANPKAPVDVQLLNRQGVPLRTMKVGPAPKPSEVQVELPLGGLAQADYLLRFTVTAAGGKTTRLLPFTLAP